LTLLSLLALVTLEILDHPGRADHDQDYGPQLAEAKNIRIEVIQEKQNAERYEQ
jgi:hypothetical protein